MSERYGKCPNCLGYGTVVVIEKPPVDFKSANILVVVDGEKTTIECYRCGGTGFDGSSEKHRDC